MKEETKFYIAIIAAFTYLALGCCKDTTENVKEKTTNCNIDR
jgi:hypothetical protein